MHGGREGGDDSARRQSDRSACVHSSDVAVATALGGGDAEGVCPYAVSTGELAR
jgi:hypothetical protein